MSKVGHAEGVCLLRRAFSLVSAKSTFSKNRYSFGTFVAMESLLNSYRNGKKVSQSGLTPSTCPIFEFFLSYVCFFK